MKFNWCSLIVGTLIVLPIAVPANAVDNMLGVYADSAGTSACTAATGLVKCYVVLSNVSDSIGVSGWQFALRIDGDGEIFSPSIPGQAINIEQFPRMMLGRATPMPAQAKMVLLSFSAYADGPTSIYVDPLSESLPAAILLASTGQLRQVDYVYGGGSAPVFGMGGAVCPERNVDLGGVVVVDKSNWGGLKALFR